MTQSVHKQQAGFSQTSQIHKKITIFAAARFCPHKRLNNAFMLHASTSPFYPLFAALDINAKIHEGRAVAACGRSALRWALTRVKPFSPVANCFSPLSHWWLTASRGRHIRRRPLPAIVVSSVLSPGRNGMALRVMRMTSILSTPVNCY